LADDAVVALGDGLITGKKYNYDFIKDKEGRHDGTLLMETDPLLLAKRDADNTERLVFSGDSQQCKDIMKAFEVDRHITDMSYWH